MSIGDHFRIFDCVHLHMTGIMARVALTSRCIWTVILKTYQKNLRVLPNKFIASFWNYNLRVSYVTETLWWLHNYASYISIVHSKWGPLPNFIHYNLYRLMIYVSLGCIKPSHFILLSWSYQAPCNACFNKVFMLWVGWFGAIFCWWNIDFHYLS